MVSTNHLLRPIVLRAIPNLPPDEPDQEVVGGPVWLHQYRDEHRPGTPPPALSIAQFGRADWDLPPIYGLEEAAERCWRKLWEIPKRGDWPFEGFWAWYRVERPDISEPAPQFESWVRDHWARLSVAQRKPDLGTYADRHTPARRRRLAMAV